MGVQKILIVEDEAIPALDIKNMLEELGYEVSATLSSGEEALERINDLQPDLVLMDITLEGKIDGIMTAAAITRDYAIPIVFLTAHADIGTMKEADKINPYGYLLKPVNLADLSLTISSALKRDQIEKKKPR